MTDPSSNDIPGPVSDQLQPADESPQPAGGGLDRQTKLLLALVVGAALIALFWPRGDGGPKAGGTLVDSTGATRPMMSLMEPVTLLHFWATWCPPCLAEIPQVLRLENDLSSSEGFRVLMVAVADSHEKVEKLLGANAARSFHDPRWEVASRFGTKQLPETYLLVDGREIEKFVGVTNWDDPGVRDRIRAAIAARR